MSKFLDGIINGDWDINVWVLPQVPNLPETERLKMYRWDESPNIKAEQWLSTLAGDGRKLYIEVSVVEAPDDEGKLVKVMAKTEEPADSKKQSGTNKQAASSKQVGKKRDSTDGGGKDGKRKQKNKSMPQDDFGARKGSRNLSTSASDDAPEETDDDEDSQPESKPQGKGKISKATKGKTSTQKCPAVSKLAGKAGGSGEKSRKPASTAKTAPLTASHGKPLPQAPEDDEGSAVEEQKPAVRHRRGGRSRSAQTSEPLTGYRPDGRSFFGPGDQTVDAGLTNTKKRKREKSGADLGTKRQRLNKQSDPTEQAIQGYEELEEDALEEGQLE